MGDAAEESTILAASEVKTSTSTDVAPESSSMGVEAHIEKPFAASADCHIPTGSSNTHAEDTGEIGVSLVDSTIVATSEVEEVSRTTYTDVAPESVEGDIKKTSADCRIPTASSLFHAEDVGEVHVSLVNYYCRHFRSQRSSKNYFH